MIGDFYNMATEKNNTELYFEWWLDELKSLGFVKDYTREPYQIKIKDSLPIFYNQHYKKQEPIVRNFNLFQPFSYQIKFFIIFNENLPAYTYKSKKKRKKWLIFRCLTHFRTRCD